MKNLLGFFSLLTVLLFICTCSSKVVTKGDGGDSSDQDTIHVTYEATGDIVYYPCNPGDTVQVPCLSVPGGILYIPCIDGTEVVCQDTIH